MQLILSIPWGLIPEEQWDAEMDTFAALGAPKIVLPQYLFFQEIKQTGGYPALFSRRLKKYGLTLGAAHALLGPENDLGCASPAALENHKRFLRELAFVGGISTYTAHSGAHYTLPSESISEAHFWEHFKRSVDELLPVLEETGIIMTLENIYAPLKYLRQMVDIVLQYNHPNLGFCLDSGHANISKHGLDVVYDLFKPRLITAHLHDNDGITDQHLAPGMGTIDWLALCQKIKMTPGMLNVQTETKEITPAIWQSYQNLFLQNMQ